MHVAGSPRAARTRPRAERRAAPAGSGCRDRAAAGHLDRRQAGGAALEDHAVVVAATGAGKSRDVMIPAALDAPGALVITCTRADILDVVATRRARAGRVWVFDPLERLGWPEPMV